MSDSERKSEQLGAATNNAPASKAIAEERGSQLQDEFKEGGYGWVVVIANALLNAHTWGLNSSFAVFLAYYLRNDSIEGASPLGFAFVGGLSISISLLVSPIATVLAGGSKVGTRKTIFIGTIFQTISFIGASFTTALWHLLLTQGLAFGIGMGLIFVASVPVPSQWFTKRRSLANACAAAGSGFGGLVYSLAINAMISSLGLAWTFRVLAVVCFIVNSACSLLVRDRNKAVGSVHVAFNWDLFKRPPFLLFEGWLILSLIPYCALVFSIVDYCRAVGLSASQASLVGALLNLSQGIGRPIIGLSSDSVGRINVACFCTAFCGVLCVTLWVFAKTLATCVVFALLVGGVAGVMWATAAPVLAEVVGVPLLPSALSMSWLLLVLPATFAEVIALQLRNRGYLAVQFFIGFFYLAAFIFLWTLRAWKVTEIENAHLNKEQRDIAILDDSTVPPEQREQRDISQKSTTTHESFIRPRGFWAYKRV